MSPALFRLSRPNCTAHHHFGDPEAEVDVGGHPILLAVVHRGDGVAQGLVREGSRPRTSKRSVRPERRTALDPATRGHRWSSARPWLVPQLRYRYGRPTMNAVHRQNDVSALVKPIIITNGTVAASSTPFGKLPAPRLPLLQSDGDPDDSIPAKRPSPMFRVSREIEFCYGHRLHQLRRQVPPPSRS